MEAMSVTALARPRAGPPGPAAAARTKMPLRRGGRWRKRWRYVGAFCDELLLCAARVQVGPLGQTFWAIWDREGRQMWERTRLRLPGRARRGLDREPGRRRGHRRLRARRGRRVVRIEAPTRRGRRGAGLPARRRRPLGGGRLPQPARASTCGRESGPTFRSSATFGSASAAGGSRRAGSRTSRRATTRTTRSGAGRPASARPPTGARSAGTWSAASTTRRSAPSARSGSTASPSSPGPVSFDGLEAIAFDDGARLEFTRRVRAAKARRTACSSATRYRQPFGSFTGTLPGGLELERGLGVMEHHDAHW